MGNDLGLALQVLGQLLTPLNLALMAGGVIVGILEGGFSGSGGSLLLAILLPFIIHMQPLTALTFMLAAHAGVAFGGSITAILLNVPGNSEVVAVCWDGYPLAKQGKASQALAAAAASTAVGGLFGAVILFTMIPLLQKVAISFAAPEYFAMTLAGIVLIALMSGDNLLRGIIAGLLGLLLSLVGQDPFTGESRYAFGSMFLSDGLPFIPVVIGLYGISQTIRLFGEIHHPVDRGVSAKYTVRGLFSGIAQVFRHFGTLISCSLLGVLTGMIPGMGGSISNILSYGLAHGISKEKDKFGKGAITGVIGPMASDNAKEGGALIPALTFGIPSTSTMTVFLAAWLMVGVTPGPDMLKNHLDLTFGMVWAIVLGNLMVALFSLLINTQISKVAQLRPEILITLIATVGLIGSYTATYSLGGIVIAILFGILGAGMEHFKFPRQTMLMGLILGSMVERNFNQALQGYGWSFLQRPIVLGILALCLFGSIAYLARNLRQRQAKVQGGLSE